MIVVILYAVNQNRIKYIVLILFYIAEGREPNGYSDSRRTHCRCSCQESGTVIRVDMNADREATAFMSK